MNLVNDLEATLLLAIGLSAKRGPVDLPGIMAAVDLTPGALAAEFKLTDSFQRLATHGLIVGGAEGIALSDIGQEILAAQPKKAATPELRIERLKATLTDYHASGEDEPMDMTVEQVRAEIAAHRAGSRGAAKNMVLTREETAEKDKRRGPWGKGKGPSGRWPGRCCW